MQRRKRKYLGPLLIPQLGTNDTRQSCADGVSVLVDEDASVVVELDEAAVFALLFLSRSDDHSVSDISSPHFVRDSNTRTA